MNPHTSSEPLQLNDIKGIVEIPDNSIYYFSASVVAAVIVLALIAYLLFRYIRREKAVNLQKQYIASLKAISLEDAKQAAYEISYYANLIEKDAPQEKAYQDLIRLLDAYKYKKEVEPLSDAVKQEYNYFIGLL